MFYCMDSVLFIHLSINGYLSYSTFCFLWRVLLWTFMYYLYYKFLCGHEYVFSSLGYIPRSGIAGAYDNFMFIYWGILKLFQNDCTILHSQQQHIRLDFFPISSAFVIVFFIFVIRVGEKWYLTVILKTTDVEHLLTCLLAIWISSLEKFLFKSFTHF